MKDSEHRKQAALFARKWQERGDEKSDTQIFWLTLLRDVYGVEHPEEHILFEEKLSVDNTRYIDARIPATGVLIEQKSIEKKLDERIKQSDGQQLTPYQQARKYIADLPKSEHPRWVVTCNFSEFYIYDMETPGRPPEIILLSDLPHEWNRLSFLVDLTVTSISRQTEVSVRAGQLIGELYAMLRPKYYDPDSTESQQSLNKLCVRIVFCLYAEDTDIFGKRNAFHDYLEPYRNRPADFRRVLIDLFSTLDTPYEKRRYLDPQLEAFPYVNGGLFAGEIEIPMPDKEFIDLLLDKASIGFDWSPISPTIFGSVFESTLNPETRHERGMHYTSIENIHKVIDPLFLNDLRAELDKIINNKNKNQRIKQLTEYRRKLAELSFLDPACGSGNFLTETYISLRRLENEALRAFENQANFAAMDLGGTLSPIMVRLSNFHGIELNDFAVSVAETALWIAESQMMRETQDIVKSNLNLLPLKNYRTIIEGNALSLDWHEVVDTQSLNFIIGNPPFIGARVMSKAQKAELTGVLGAKWKGVGNLDYVAGWYKKSADMIKGTDIRAALVSTNSICQGEQVSLLWNPLLSEGVQIDFAHRTFQWDSESTDKAHVHCVIVGFSNGENNQTKIIFNEKGESETVENISPYLIEGPDTVAESRTKPICEAPQIGIGNQPIDNGNYLFTAEEMNEFIKKEPAASGLFHPWYGANEFINGQHRYCLWLGDCSPKQLRELPYCLKLIENVRDFRLRSNRSSTRKLANKPTLFQVENIPESDYLIIPKTSSENRRYIPIGFKHKNDFASDLVFIVQDAGLYHFGVLTSRIHMAWVDLIGGRLKSDYRYSKDIVYNNFPWPEPDEKQKRKIEKTAKTILEVRDKFPDCSLADLYHPLTMPDELLEAHRANDKAVAKAYGLSSALDYLSIGKHLLFLYNNLIS